MFAKTPATSRGSALFRRVATFPMFSFRRKSSAGFREEDLARACANLQRREENEGPTSSVRRESHASVSTEKPTRRDSLGSQDEGSHEPLWVKEIHQDEEEFEEKHIASDASLEIVDVPAIRLDEDFLGSSEVDSLHFDADGCQQRMRTSSSCFKLEMDVEKNRVTISKPSRMDTSVLTPTYATEYRVDQTPEVIFAGDELAMSSAKSVFSSCKSDPEDVNIVEKLQKSYEDVSKAMIAQLLSDDFLSDSWVTVIKNISTQVAETVSPNYIYDNDDMDIRQYLKIKSITGGSKQDSAVINGLVFTHNVAHRKMKQSFQNPRVLLFACPIIYQEKSNTSLISLDSLIMNETAYLQSITNKIAYINPDIVVVEKEVARKALDMFLELGITLVKDVKRATVEQLSRVTTARIITNLDDPIDGMSLGVCDKFYLQTFNQFKTLMYFDGCPVHLGCTVILRGSLTEEKLKKVKEICSFAIFCDHSWRLEKAFLMDMFAVPKSTKKEIIPLNLDIMDDSTSPVFYLKCDNFERNESIERRVESITIEDDSDPLRSMAHECDASTVSILSPTPVESDTSSSQPITKRDFKATVNHLISLAVLLSSPNFDIKLPYLLSKEADHCPLKQYIAVESLYFTQRLSLLDAADPTKPRLTVEESALTLKEEVSPTENLRFNRDLHPFYKRNLVYPIRTSLALQSLIADYRARGLPFVGENVFQKRPQTQEKSKQPQAINRDLLHPRYHQRLPVLYCSYSYTSNQIPYCVNPWIIDMEFYGALDITIGSFLKKYCFSPGYVCPVSGCNTIMVDHTRKFIHGDGCVQVNLKLLSNAVEAAQENIIGWSWCQKCKTSSPFVALSRDSLHLSFAKYLELRLCGSKYSRRAAGEAPACLEHSLFQDQLQYFAFKQMVASFKYCPIVVREVSLPTSKIKVKLETLSVSQLTDQLKSVTIKGYDALSTILSTLHSLKEEVEGTKYETVIKDYLTSEINDRLLLRKKIDETHISLSSQPDAAERIFIKDNIIMIFKFVSDFVYSWNTLIQEFINNKKKEEKLNPKGSIVGQSITRIAGGGEYEGTPNSSSYAVTSKHPEVSEVRDGGPDHSPRASGEVPHIVVAPDTPVSTTTSKYEGTDNSEFLDSFKACICEQQEEFITRIEALDNLKVDDVADDLSETEHLKDSFSDTSISSIAYGVTPGISSKLGRNAVLDGDTESYAVYHQNSVPVPVLADSFSDSNKKTEEAVLQSSNAVSETSRSIGSIRNTTVKPSAVKSLLTQILSNPTSNSSVEYPFEPTEHYLPSMNNKLPVVVNDHDPGSIIAFSLASAEYEKALSELTRIATSPGAKRKIFMDSTNASLIDAKETSDVASAANPTKNASNPPSLHIDLQFNDNTTKFYCCVYFAEQFRRLRSEVLEQHTSSSSSTSSPVSAPTFGSQHASESLFIRSIAHCLPWTAKGGKSGSTFFKSANDRFILKEMSRAELHSFLNIAQYYFEHMSNSISDMRPTLLAKIFGVYKISHKNSATNSASKIYLLAMENFFYRRNICQKFDLKGSMRNRLASTNTPDDVVLLDENLLKMCREAPLFIRSHGKAILQKAITWDSYFLASHSVMDYSLLVGVDNDKKEFVLGIIDYIRPFTWDKKIEMMVKSVGSHGKTPTIVSPDVYRERFCEKMNQYFLYVPDRWHGFERVETNVTNMLENFTE